VDVHRLLAECHRILEHDAALKHQTVTIRMDAMAHHVRGDPARLQQVFWNLIKNAIKFTGDGGHITIRTLNRDDGRLAIQVTDNGIGIAPAALSRVFSAFEQGGDTITRRFGGLGLGLTISKGLVELHGGELTAESEGEGKGTTMSVSLPVTADAIPEEEARDSAQPEAGASILVVDDDEPTARTLARLLTRRGYEVATATACAQARETLRGRRFDILLADLSLPDGSGLDLMREIPPESRTKGIALSGFGTEADIQASLAAGFTTHLVKPVDIDEVTGAIGALGAP
jgi:CheY-like chemotaxis protein/anti-sigma regulatory factor (Ser/Thr protein kinase)